MLAPPALHPVDDKLRVLDLQVKTANGETLDLQLPWDRTAFDLEPALVAGTVHDKPARTVLAFAQGAAEGVDLLEVPLGKVLQHAENPEGVPALVIQVAAEGWQVVEFTITCSGSTAEPEAHQPYPRPIGEGAARRLNAYMATGEPEWFCDGSSTLSCCTAQREAPEHINWVVL
jgi:hypothetical protein